MKTRLNNVSGRRSEVFRFCNGPWTRTDESRTLQPPFIVGESVETHTLNESYSGVYIVDVLGFLSESPLTLLPYLTTQLHNQPQTGTSLVSKGEVEGGGKGTSIDSKTRRTHLSLNITVHPFFSSKDFYRRGGEKIL